METKATPLPGISNVRGITSRAEPKRMLLPQPAVYDVAKSRGRHCRRKRRVDDNLQYVLRQELSSCFLP
jgi:hypothetical protein